jgi:hypothetical protein
MARSRLRDWLIPDCRRVSPLALLLLSRRQLALAESFTVTKFLQALSKKSRSDTKIFACADAALLAGEGLFIPNSETLLRFSTNAQSAPALLDLS